MWLRDHENEVYSKTESWLNTADFLAWKLCGVPVTDFSLASRTFALDIRSLQYAEDLLEEVRIPVGWYQDLVPSGTYLGPVLTEIAQETGLDEKCSVASGGHDHFVGAISAGALKNGTLTDSMGTAESLTVFLDQPEVISAYAARLVLVRPDGHVAWRADALPDDPARLIDRVRGV